jgi:hypothetical protein
MSRAANCLAAIVAVASAFVSIPSVAAVQCKSSPAAGMGLSESDAINSWRSWVTSHHGSGWSNFDLATGKYWTETNLGVAVMRQVSAVPCRQSIIINTVPLGGMKVLRP